MQETLINVLKSLCGEPLYKAIYKDSRGNEVARPVFTVPELYRKRNTPQPKQRVFQKVSNCKIILIFIIKQKGRKINGLF